MHEISPSAISNRASITKAQHCMKQQVDQHQTEREFEEGDFVFLRLKSYHSMKLTQHFYGTYRILQKNQWGSMLSRLDFLFGPCILNFGFYNFLFLYLWWLFVFFSWSSICKKIKRKKKKERKNEPIGTVIGTNFHCVCLVTKMITTYNLNIWKSSTFDVISDKYVLSYFLV
jgi:hypothetical protein